MVSHGLEGPNVIDANLVQIVSTLERGNKQISADHRSAFLWALQASLPASMYEALYHTGLCLWQSSTAVKLSLSCTSWHYLHASLLSTRLLGLVKRVNSEAMWSCSLKSSSKPKNKAVTCHAIAETSSSLTCRCSCWPQHCKCAFSSPSASLQISAAVRALRAPPYQAGLMRPGHSARSAATSSGAGTSPSAGTQVK